MSHTRLLTLFVLVAAAAASPRAASGPTFWTTATAADFLKGTSDGVFVNLTGVVTAGPQLTSRLTSTPAQVWSIAQAGDGTFWAGTGADGRIIRLRPGQAEQTVFDAPENNVFALAVSGSRVYAATGPDGQVYVIEGDTARPFFNPTEKYIWALAVDANGWLWVGAGNPAVIYRVDASGASTVVYRPPAAHVVTLARDANGRMLAGTESPGRLYRFENSDRPFAVLDADAVELSAVAAAPGGALYAAAVLKSDDSTAGETTAVAATVLAAPPPTGAPPSSGSAGSAPPRRSVLYEIDSNGTWEAIWTTPDVIYDLAADSEGVMVATGPAGRLYRVSRTRDVSLLTGVDAKQITRFVQNDRTRALAAFATANPGRVVAVGASEQLPATYTSAVRDTKSSATWGLIRWEATAPMSVATRSGNTETPDDSWSDWSAPYTRKEGQPVTSPPARFLQWRAVFSRPAAPSASKAALTSVTVAYLTTNSRPVVTSITVYPPGVVFQRPFANEEGAIAGMDEAVANARRAPGDPGPTAPPPGRRWFQRGLQTIAWKADDDDDGDRLTYTLEYRREGTDTWRPLRSNLSDSIYVWETGSTADGRYVVRVRASDGTSNAVDRALTGERESDPIDIDNTPPAITTEIARQGNAARLLVHVVDARSPVQRVEYSVGGGPWQLVYPVDGLSDAPDERYEIPLTADMDPSRIMLRATDLLQNVMTQPAAGR